MTDYPKRLKILIGVNAALALAIAIGLIASASVAGARSTRVDLLPRADSVSEIKIEGAESILLVKSGAAWTMSQADGQLPVDAQRVASFLKAVDSVDRAELVASGESSWDALGLRGESARRVTLSGDGGKALSDFILGRYATAPGAVYAALYGGKDAYSVPSGMSSYIVGSRASWLDLRVWTTPPDADSVQELSVKGRIESLDGKTVEAAYTLTRSGRDWIGGPAALDPAKVDAMIRAIASLRGADYAPASEKSGQAAVAVELRLGNGRTLSLSVEARRDDGSYPAVSSQRDRRFYLPSWALTEVCKPLSALLAG